MKSYYFLGLTLLAFMGCTLAEVRVSVVSERTALENQVLGSYNSLDQDMLLSASVRGVDPLGRIQRPLRQSREHRDAVEGMQIIAFHGDDVETFKKLGWVGENNEGLLTPFPMTKENVSKGLAGFATRYKEEEFKSVLKEVNQARESVMQRVVDINESFSREDLPRIRRVFGKINRENALPGERIQNEDGTWSYKKP